MRNTKSLVEQAIANTLHFDIETLGTERGSAIYELSLFDPRKNQVTQYRLAPNLTIADPQIKGQDAVGYKSKPGDVFIEHPLLTHARRFKKEVKWKDVVIAQVLMDENATIFKSEMDKVYPNLTVKDVLAMKSEKEFTKYIQTIKAIGADEQLFRAGTIESSVFMARALKEKADLDSIGKPGAPVDPKYIERMQKELSDYMGSDVKFVAKNATIDELLGKDSPFIDQISGRHLAAANLNFESKQVGAAGAVKEQDIRTLLKEGKISVQDAAYELRKISPIRNVLGESAITVSDIFTQSGKELALAKSRAQITGDYSKMFMPYLMEATKAGPYTTTGDILDIAKMQQSFEQNLGLSQKSKVSTMSVDVLQRLYGYSEEISKALTLDEKHIGAFDVISQGKKVYPSALRQTYALSEIAEGTLRGKELLKEMASGTGDLRKAFITMKTREIFQPVIQESNILTRMGRALEDIITKGDSAQTSGKFEYGGVRQRTTPTGEIVKRPVAMPAGGLTKYSKLEDVLSHIEADSLYKHADFSNAMSEFIGTINKEAGKDIISFDEKTRQFSFATDDKGRKLVRREHLKYLEIRKREMIDAKFQEVAKGLDISSFDDYVKGMENRMLSKHSWIARHQNFKMIDFANGRFAGLAAIGMSAIGLGAAALGEQRIKHQRTGPESLRTMNYDRWFEANSDYYGLESHKDRFEEGFSPSGLASMLRSLKTDFGSPYQGPTYSNYIFREQEVLRERQKYELKRFADVHFNDGGEINDMLKSSMMPKGITRNFRNLVEAFSLSGSAIRRGNSFITDGEMVNVKGKGGLSAQQLFKVDLNNYQISASDADTLVLQRKGSKNPLANFFGLGGGQNKFSVRLSAIDAPETAKEDREGMPFADTALGRLRAMMKRGKKLELFLNPGDITYGRQVGSLFVDGKNVELDLVKSGNARFLNFKGKNKQIFDTRVFRKMEKLAQGNDSGMWGDPYYKPFEEVMNRSGKSVTFNSLVNISKVAESANLMSLRSLMNVSRDMGFYSPVVAEEASKLAEKARGEGFSADYKTPILFNAPNAPHRAYMTYMQEDITKLMRTKGGNVSDKFSSAGYKQLDKRLAIDTAGTTNSPYSRRRYEAFSRFNVDNRKRRLRKFKMAEGQKAALRKFNESPIGHYRM